MIRDRVEARQRREFALAQEKPFHPEAPNHTERGFYGLAGAAFLQLDNEDRPFAGDGLARAGENRALAAFDVDPDEADIAKIE